MKINAKHNQILVGVILWLSLMGVLFGTAYMPIDSKRKIEIPFIEIDQHQALIFFGFPSCGSICPTTMTELNKLVSSLPVASSELGVVFVNIDTDSTSESTNNYAKAFNTDFIGYLPSEDELMKMTQMFGLNIKKNRSDFQHQGKVYLLSKENNNWFIIKTFNSNDYTFNQLRDSLV